MRGYPKVSGKRGIQIWIHVEPRYSFDETRDWVQQGCRSAGIGCIECKQPVIDAIQKELAPIRERAQVYLDDPTLVRNIISDGNDRARKLAAETMRDVREAMGLDYS